MKKFILAGFIAVTALTVSMSSCKKYEDGPAFSLLTKKARICNTWVLEQYLVGTDDQTTAFLAFAGNDYQVEINKDGSYKVTTNGNALTGTWDLGEDKDDVTFTQTSPTASTTTARIQKLKSKELWLRETESNGTYDYYHYKQK